MEENEFCSNPLLEEVEELMSIDVLCGLCVVEKEDGENTQDDDDKVFKTNEPAFDVINKYATKLKEIYVVWMVEMMNMVIW